MTRDLVAVVELYVRQCFQRSTAPRVDELAQRLGTHPSVLSRRFKLTTGRRLSSVLKERQIEEAKHLLDSTDMDTRAIASRAGFGTVNTLFRLFRTHVGRTPEEYRQASDRRS